MKSNRESGAGRPDIVITEDEGLSIAIIIEVKVADSLMQLENKCDEALQQIEDRNYSTELILEGYQKILKYGISFYNKSCKVKPKKPECLEN